MTDTHFKRAANGWNSCSVSFISFLFKSVVYVMKIVILNGALFRFGYMRLSTWTINIMWTATNSKSLPSGYLSSCSLQLVLVEPNKSWTLCWSKDGHKCILCSIVIYIIITQYHSVGFVWSYLGFNVFWYPIISFGFVDSSYEIVLAYVMEAWEVSRILLSSVDFLSVGELTQTPSQGRHQLIHKLQGNCSEKGEPQQLLRPWWEDNCLEHNPWCCYI